MSSKLSLNEWVELPEEKKGDRYKDLSEHDRYLVRIGGCSGGVGVDLIPEEELTEEQRKEWERQKAIIESMIEEANKRKDNND